MSLAKREAYAALLEVAQTIVETIKGAGSIGVPGGNLYAVLMTSGCTLEQFHSLMAGLIGSGLVVKKGDCYFAKTV